MIVGTVPNNHEIGRGSGGDGCHQAAKEMSDSPDGMPSQRSDIAKIRQHHADQEDQNDHAAQEDPTALLAQVEVATTWDKPCQDNGDSLSFLSAQAKPDKERRAEDEGFFEHNCYSRAKLLS